jgi:DNA helicase IV
VDEAQDLSAMELRMVARRSPKRSMTILGDLAQATSPGGQTDWHQAIGDLEVERASIDELTVGYRVPEPVMAFANQLLPYAAPGLQPPSSVRLSGEPPRITRASPVTVATDAAREVAKVAAEWNLTGVVVPESLRSAIAQALGDEGVSFVDSTAAATIGEHVTLLAPASTKGLEFDAVVVVEPAAIVAETDGDLRLLYVVLTRAVQHLSVVHADPLPAPLADRSAGPSPY